MKKSIKQEYEEKLASRDREIYELGLLVRCQEMINSTFQLETVLDYLMELAKKATDSEAASALLLEGDKLYFASASGVRTSEIKRVYLGRNEGIAGWVIDHGEAVLVEDVSKDKRFSHRADMISGFITRSIIAVPLDVDEKVIGVVEAVNKKNGKVFNDNDIRLLNSLATSAAMAINKAQQYRDLNDLFISTIKAIANAIEAKDPYTRGHSERIRNYSLVMARELGLRDVDIKNLEISALLHDVGKIGIPEAILQKHGKLTAAERAEMARHPLIGAEILSSIKQIKAAIPGIRHHQERFDGKGYPDGLEGEAIPLPARIIAVADTFDAMTSDRPYRDALSDEESLKEIERLAGGQFDPKCVRALVIGYNKRLINSQRTWNSNGK